MVSEGVVCQLRSNDNLSILQMIEVRQPQFMTGSNLIHLDGRPRAILGTRRRNCTGGAGRRFACRRRGAIQVSSLRATDRHRPAAGGNRRGASRSPGILGSNGEGLVASAVAGTKAEADPRHAAIETGERLPGRGRANT